MAKKCKSTEEMKRHRIWPIIAAAVGMILVFTACGPKQTQIKTEEPPAQTPSEKVENDDQQKQQEEQREDDVISTIYGELSYPGMWTDRVHYEITEDGADVQITFSTTVEDAEVKLFTLCYGTVPEDGYEMGALLTDGDVLVPVSTVMYPIVPEESWSEDTANEVYALQESANDLLVQLYEDPNFTPA